MPKPPTWPWATFPPVLADLTARAQAGTLVPREHRRLYDGEYVAVMRKDHPLAWMPLTLEHYCAAKHLLVKFFGPRLRVY